MPDTSSDLVPSEKALKLAADANLGQIMTILSSCRGFAMSCGTLAVLHATAETEQESEELAADFFEARSNFLSAIGAEDQPALALLKDIKELATLRRDIYSFRDRLKTMPATDLSLSRSEAADLANVVRKRLTPAIQSTISFMRLIETKRDEDRMLQVGEKAALVDGMLAEMGRIGRMIGLISINASVEAARAGGEQGRAFQVIAEEVRNLARQSSDVLDRMRRRMEEDGIGQADKKASKGPSAKTSGEKAKAKHVA